MHLRSLLYGLIFSVPANARLGHVYLSESGNTPQESQTLTPSNARLVLAQRLGLGEFHSLERAEETTLNAINAFGGGASQLFNAVQPRHLSRAIVLLEGVEGADILASSFSHGIQTFTIEDPPSAEANKRLIYDFKTQNSLHAKQNALHSLSHTRWHLDSLNTELGHLAVCDNFTDAGLTAFICAGSSTSAPQANLKETLEAVFSWSKRHDVELVTLLMPPEQKTSLFKRASTSSWGSYTATRQADSPTNANGSPFAELADKIGLISHEDDDVDSDARKSSSGIISPTATYSAHPRPTHSSKPKPIVPPRGILPACYSSISACESTTNNCSGHGACALKYSYPVEDDRKVECFACGCVADVRKVGNGGTKTTKWSGPACQKVDVSTEFWLIGGFTVVLVSVVAWAIGLLYAMGQQDLPSVIGAGVAGPRPK